MNFLFDNESFSFETLRIAGFAAMAGGPRPGPHHRAARAQTRRS